MKKYLILSLSLILLFAACNKKPGASAPTREDILRSGKWKITSGTLTVTLPNGKDTTLNYMDWIPSCRQDDYIVFDSGIHAALFSNSTKCNVSDPDSISFQWLFTSNYSYLTMDHGFDFFYGISDSVLPFRFDTLQQSPLVLDTVHGVLDTDAAALAAGYTRVLIVLDTVWKLQFDTVAMPTTAIYNAQVTNFTESSFTISYSLTQPPITSRPDTTGFHTGWIIDNTTTPPDTADFQPIYRPDVFRYKVTYTKY